MFKKRKVGNKRTQEEREESVENILPVIEEPKKRPKFGTKLNVSSTV